MGEENLLSTNLSGRIRNTTLAKSKCIMVLYEAVVNSIQSIDELEDNADGKIIIDIVRDVQDGLLIDEKMPTPKIKSLKITDNGIGFTEENYKSFKTLDSTYKADKGGHGIGRLIWLKCFDSVSVDSVYSENNKKKQRCFSFSAQQSIHNQTVVGVNENVENKTIVTLNNIVKNYKEVFPQDANTISNLLVEHCIWFFLREGGVPEIIVNDNENNISINLNELFDQLMLEKGNPKKVQIKEQEFEFTHIKLNANVQKEHSINFCASGRVVTKEKINGKIRGLFDVLTDEKGQRFYCVTYVTANYLNEHVLPERDEFDLDKERKENLFNEISIQEIREEVEESIKEYLHDFLEKNCLKGKERLIKFVDNQAPRYKPIIDKLSEDKKIVDPNISNKDLDIQLHKALSEIEETVIAEGHKLLETEITEDTNMKDYEMLLEKYLSYATDLKKSDLANYVSHRRVVLDLLKKAIEIQSDDKYVKESIIHNLIIPMKKTSTEVSCEANNLWLINERLTFHNYLASDKQLKEMPIIESVSEDRPDIISLNVYDNPLLISEKAMPPLASITVIELKRPMRDDMTETDNPIDQALGYLGEIRKGKCKTALGRPIPECESIPGFCYIIADLTDSLIRCCNSRDLIPTADKMGYFGYHKYYNAYIEVISFSQLYQSANERNKAFFDKLGLPNV